MAEKKTCFVVMGFGVKTDYLTGRTLDLNKTYEFIIKPAAEEAGLECVRADEIVHSGIIDPPMFQLLLDADVVVADLSTSNANAIYQLGIRHALKPKTTIVMAEDKFISPFDVGHMLILKYRHLGSDIGAKDAEDMRDLLSKRILSSLNSSDIDSPLYTFLPHLMPPTTDLSSDSVSVVADRHMAAGGTATSPGTDEESIAVMTSKAEEALNKQEWIEAKSRLEKLRLISPKDAQVVQRLAFATYKSRYPTQQDAIEDALEILSPLAEAMNEPGVLSMWGDIHRRRWELLADRDALNIAISAYQKVFSLQANYRDGTALAFLLNARASFSEQGEGIADFVTAQRVRHEVIALCNRMLDDGEKKQQKLPDEYSIRAALAEAWCGLGDELGYTFQLESANALNPDPSLQEATADRIEKLRMHLTFSPIAYLTSV